MTDTQPALAIHEAARRLQKVVRKTPLQHHLGLSKRYNCTFYLKREDLQIVRSYKLRGAYYLMGSSRAWSVPVRATMRTVLLGLVKNWEQKAWS